MWDEQRGARTVCDRWVLLSPAPAEPDTYSLVALTEPHLPPGTAWLFPHPFPYLGHCWGYLDRDIPSSVWVSHTYDAITEIDGPATVLLSTLQILHFIERKVSKVIHLALLTFPCFFLHFPSALAT